jgi:hypothetical protein
MRRLLSISLLLAMLLPLVPQASAATGMARLAACCRKGGVHHCVGTMSMPAPGGSGAMLEGERCPSFPMTTAPAHGLQWALWREQSQFAAVVAHPTARPQTEARYRVSFGRSRQKRGPPSAILL